MQWACRSTIHEFERTRAAPPHARSHSRFATHAEVCCPIGSACLTWSRLKPTTERTSKDSSAAAHRMGTARAPAASIHFTKPAATYERPGQ